MSEPEAVIPGSTPRWNLGPQRRRPTFVPPIQIEKLHHERRHLNPHESGAETYRRPERRHIQPPQKRVLRRGKRVTLDRPKSGQYQSSPRGRRHIQIHTDRSEKGVFAARLRVVKDETGVNMRQKRGSTTFGHGRSLGVPRLGRGTAKPKSTPFLQWMDADVAVAERMKAKPTPRYIHLNQPLRALPRPTTQDARPVKRHLQNRRHVQLKRSIEQAAQPHPLGPHNIQTPM